MWYLFIQTWVLLLIAFILGWWAHWFFCCRNKECDSDTNDSAAATTAAAVTSAAATVASSTETEVEVSDDWKPQGFASAPADVDDLKRIKGIGAVIEKTLNELGVYQFQQISEWTTSNISWVENFISFPGRIEREGWISQAKTLATGGSTEFAQRVDKGDVDY